MKPLKFVLILSLFFSMSSFAQNWSLVMPNDTLVYEKQDNHQFFTVWVDSTHVNGTDTTYYMNRISPGDSVGSTSQTNLCANPNIWQPSFNLFTLSKPQFCGISIENSNGKWTIELPQKKLVIYPNSPVGSTWVYDSILMDSIVITSADTTFLNAYQGQDSIKTFSAPGFSLTLSKNHGIINMTDIEMVSSVFNLIGVQNLGLGETIPMGVEHFNYEVGDVFFRRSAYGDSDDFTTNKYMTTILSKSYTGDTLIYSIKRHVQSSHYTSQSGGGTTQNSNVSTQLLKYWPNMHPFLSAYPNTLALSYGFNCNGYSFANDSLPKKVLIYKSSDNRITRSNAKDVQSGSSQGYGTYSFCTVDSANLYAEVQAHTFPIVLKKGLGLVLESHVNLYSCEYKLNGYIKTDGTSWGDTTYISSVSEVDYLNFIHIYPNPTHNLINITTEKLNGTSLLEMYDLRGRLIITRTFENNLKLDISQYKSSIYFMVIKDEQGLVMHREKVIIQ